MNNYIQMFVTVVCAVIASSGFWAFLQKISDKKDDKTKLLLGIAHELICMRCDSIIERGWTTYEELEDLEKYLYKPYKNNGGNGSAELRVNAAKKVEVRRNTYAF